MTFTSTYDDILPIAGDAVATLDILGCVLTDHFNSWRVGVGTYRTAPTSS